MSEISPQQKEGPSEKGEENEKREKRGPMIEKKKR
jgi:hypothetical protein